MDFKHEIITSNKDISVKFQYSEDTGSIVSKHWHRSLEYLMDLVRHICCCR